MSSGHTNQKPYPPRLQHTPSLPNIRFPPHSGPISPQMAKDTTDIFSSAQLKSSLASFREKSQTRPHVKIVAQKLERRPRVETDSHKLLTPPLTPASSIRTTASVDGSVSSADQSDHATGGDVDDTCSSRFLLIDNVALDASRAVISRAIDSLTAQKLASYRPDSKLPTPVTPSTADPTAPKPIKGLLHRKGLVLLAFHDIRDAIAAAKFFETRENDEFNVCVGPAKDAAGRQRLTCQFLTMDQVIVKIGPSDFLSSMDPTLEVTIEPDVPTDEAIYEERGNRDALLLKNLFGSADDIRSISDTVPQEGSNSARKTFRVEYFDIRDVAPAYERLNGKVMFGTKITASKCEEVQEEEPADFIQAIPTEKIVPFPICRAFDDSIQPFGPPGQFSQTRQPFFFPLDDVPASVYSESRSSGSPPVFYSSESPDRPHNTSAPNGQVLDVQQHQLLQTYYNPSAEGYVYHVHDSASTPAPLPMGPYYAPTPTSPTPLPFLHGYMSPPPHFQTPAPLPALHGALLPFERDASMMWPVELINGVPTFAAPAFALSPSLAPSADPYWVQGVTPTSFPASPASYFPPGLSRMPGPGYFVPPPGDQQLPSATLTSTHEGSPHSSSSPPHTHMVKNTNNNNNNAGSSSTGSGGKKDNGEHNQLNLANVESGVDTRTTVMIKNIPNKMSDKDLKNYLDKVCPRRIDFLYLRMDFKNGCNVRYAFVNFISVADLILFAKKRLGQKWNMFSSEKVLQMSYANYQGKEALVEKFKNSCIMDEKPEWQPKIFYSDPGPEQGLPEPFPAATHQRRKERSSHNRGSLYVPGHGNHLQGPGQNTNLLNAPPFNSRRLEYNEPRARSYRRLRSAITGE
ncbi:RNA recognition motif 2-domain-containing protein [Rhodocollybia butyracea]|uniref:RNA recognition motif 2-domain-containing protein n=1 Tax=Rhodocollybia butyracea TaxID=206335 RepID=A0A9P5PVD7_9AGAR|nr:RNA recognition motif 2-domain-containing protein [Rhodocollybia butyracea]